jgi:hypothetical protein
MTVTNLMYGINKALLLREITHTLDWASHPTMFAYVVHLIVM